MTASAVDPYDPRTFQARTFYDATPRFRDGSDTPRAYLEHCLETITAREPVVQAEALEQTIANAGAICNAITGWENRWALRNLVDEHPDGVSQRAKKTLARAEAMSPEDYRAAGARDGATLLHQTGTAGRCRDHALLSGAGALLAR